MSGAPNERRRLYMAVLSPDDGTPDEAIPVLERRLGIPNQEDEVREELEAAYAEASNLLAEILGSEPT
jgi:hypothetical protein